MKKFLSALLILPFLILASCRSVSDEEKAPVKIREFTGDDETGAYQAASSYMQSFFQSLETGDFSHWKKILDEQRSDRITEEKFNLMCNELQMKFGKFEKSEFLGELTTGNFRNYLWKVRFNKMDNNRNIIRDVVYYTKVFCPENGQPAVSGFGVKLF